MKPKKLFAFELLVKLEKVDVILRRGTEKERRQKKYELIFESLQLAREAGKAEVKEGCSCGNDVVYLSYCMECLHDLEVKGEQRGAQAERERWEKSIVIDEYSETIGCWMVSKAMLRKQGVKI